jgi:hypothetical protein
MKFLFLALGLYQFRSRNRGFVTGKKTDPFPRRSARGLSRGGGILWLTHGNLVIPPQVDIPESGQIRPQGQAIHEESLEIGNVFRHILT